MTNLINFPQKQDKLKRIPIVEQAYFLLNTFDTPGGLKLTENGNLNRKVVHAFWDKFLNIHERTFSRPSRELECRTLTKIKFLLQDSGYTKVYKGKMHLTKKGTAILQSHSSLHLYRDLLDSAIMGWNWGFEDRYPEFPFIQDSAVDLVGLLWNFPDQTITPIQLFEQAFDFFEGEGEEVEEDLDPYSAHFSLKNQLTHCLSIRFFARFSVPFGLLEAPGNKDDFFSDIEGPYKKTDFFINDFPEVIESEIEEL